MLGWERTTPLSTFKFRKQLISPVGSAVAIVKEHREQHEVDSAIRISWEMGPGGQKQGSRLDARPDANRQGQRSATGRTVFPFPCLT